MIHCEKFRADQSENTCIARQKTLHQAQTITYGTVAVMAAKFRGCEGCKMGLALYKKSQKGEKFAMNGKPDEKLKKCSDCGGVFPPDLGHFDVANRAKDGLTNACRVCRGSVDSFDPDSPATNTKSAKVEPSQAPEPQTKPCALESCDKMCVQRPGESPGSFANRKFCSDQCGQKARSIRKREVRAMARGISGFDREKAEEIARESTEKILRLAAVFINDPRALEQMRGVAFEVGVECQRRMAGAA